MKEKLLFLDIETSPNIGYTWGIYEQNVIKVIKEWEILSVAWKWQGDKTIQGVYKGKTDKNVAEKIWELLNEADIVVAHNGDRFDIPKINTRLISNGLTPPSPYKTIDTLKVVRKQFKFNSNRLNELGKKFEFGQKVKNEEDLWERSMNGEKKALTQMLKYNKQDIVLLEELYQLILPWITNHPTYRAITDRPEICPIPGCGCKRIQSRGVEKRSNNRVVNRFQCQGCHKWFYGKVTKVKDDSQRTTARTGR